MKTVTVSIEIDAAERILREAARDAALYGGLAHHVTRRTGGFQPGRGIGSGCATFDEARAVWVRKYLAAKRLVEAFGAEVEYTSSAEVLTVDYHSKPSTNKGLKKDAARLGFNAVEPDYSKPYPTYRGGTHLDACTAAAARVIRKWREALP